MIYLTGDTHGDFRRIRDYCMWMNTTPDDVMIILGDAGFNYYGNYRDRNAKQMASKIPVTLFCIHGNHEMRPATIPTYKEKEYRGGTVWYEEEYPNILFARDGDIYDFNGKQCIVIGGAYSVDKFYRLQKGWKWFPDEQPSDEIKARTEAILESVGNKIDVVLSHTCPLKYEPVEMFLSQIDQSSVDKSTEKWLDEIEAKTTYNQWYCGHWHTIKKVDKIRFLFEDYDILGVKGD